MKLNMRILGAINEVFKRLCMLRRWTTFMTEDKYSELAKQAFNCIVTYILAVESERAGKQVRWENFPKIAIYRAFQKAYVYFDTPESILKEIRDLGNIPNNVFELETKHVIKAMTDEDFTDFICEAQETYEVRIYKAASKIATYIEFVENQSKSNGNYEQTFREIIQSLKSFYDIPGVQTLSENSESAVFKVLQQISKLRNQNRWAVQAFTMDCSVLGHLFDTAVFAYLMALEQEPENEKRATKAFFMGIFHDVAEEWTKDIPSPIKDRIKGFRKATEEYESKIIEKNIYNVVPEYLAKALKDVMLEDEANIEYKKLLKGADYLSADSECYRQYLAGNRDSYFYGAIKGRKEKIRTKQVVLTPECKKLYKFYLGFSRRAISRILFREWVARTIYRFKLFMTGQRKSFERIR